MNIRILINQLHVLRTSIVFIREHILLLLSLGLLAALGRVIQLGGFGEINSAMNILLEVIVEGSRAAILLFVLGLANIRKGLSYLGKFFSSWSNMSHYIRLAFRNLKIRWASVLVSFIGFLAIAGGFNFLIDQLAYETCLLLSLKSSGILTATSSEWTILLFFKNISVIPFTLVFETILVLWLVGKVNIVLPHTPHV